MVGLLLIVCTREQQRRARITAASSTGANTAYTSDPRGRPPPYNPTAGFTRAGYPNIGAQYAAKGQNTPQPASTSWFANPAGFWGGAALGMSRGVSKFVHQYCICMAHCIVYVGSRPLVTVTFMFTVTVTGCDLLRQLTMKQVFV